MDEKNSLLESLPGSSRGTGEVSPVSNYSLMPAADPLKVPPLTAAKKDSSPAVELLGSGSKIPESQESRMLSQFAIPGPTFGSPKKAAPAESREENSWWTSEVRPMMMGCSPYKNAPAKGRDDAARAEQAAMEKKVLASQRKKLIGEKEMILSQFCSNPNSHPGSSETHRVIGMVTDINRKLGLCPTDTGSWKLPS